MWDPRRRWYHRERWGHDPGSLTAGTDGSWAPHSPVRVFVPDLCVRSVCALSYLIYLFTCLSSLYSIRWLHDGPEIERIKGTSLVIEYEAISNLIKVLTHQESTWLVKGVRGRYTILFKMFCLLIIYLIRIFVFITDIGNK